MRFLLLFLTLTLNASEHPPNIVLLLADDLGYGELGCQGNAEIPTPHIDSIAKNGVRFTQGYVTAAFCSASRAGMMTGRYQTRFGYEFNPIGDHNEDPMAGLPRSERTWRGICMMSAILPGWLANGIWAGTRSFIRFGTGSMSFWIHTRGPLLSTAAVQGHDHLASPQGTARQRARPLHQCR